MRAAHHNLIYQPIKSYSRQLYFQLRLNCVFHFTLRFHLPVPCLVPFKVSRKEPQRSSCGLNIPPQRSSCAFIMQPQRSSCSFQDSSLSDPKSAARTSCGCKKKFLRVHYFGLYCIIIHQKHNYVLHPSESDSINVNFMYHTSSF